MKSPQDRLLELPKTLPSNFKLRTQRLIPVLVFVECTTCGIDAQPFMQRQKPTSILSMAGQPGQPPEVEVVHRCPSCGETFAFDAPVPLTVMCGEEELAVLQDAANTEDSMSATMKLLND